MIKNLIFLAIINEILRFRVQSSVGVPITVLMAVNLFKFNSSLKVIVIKPRILIV